MTNDVSKLSGMMHSAPQTPAGEQEIKQESPKCRKTNYFDYYTGQEQQSSDVSSTLPESMPTLPLHDHVYSDKNISSPEADIPFLPEAQVCPDTAASSDAANPPQPFNFHSSIDTFIDKDFAADLFMNDLDTMDDFATPPLPSSSSMDPVFEKKLRDSLALLPKQMQE
eukprot:9067728-Ditylum_brightwellii.AAC.1